MASSLSAAALREKLVSSRKYDKLKHEPLRVLLVDEITKRLSANDEPGLLALFGPWGSGKSSLIECVRREIASRDMGIAWVHFDAWAYQGAGGLVAPLLTQLARARRGKATSESLKRVLLATTLYTTDALLGLVGVKDATGLASKKLAEAGALLHDVIDSRTVIHDELAAAVDALAEHRKAGLVVVVVDNLDRCAPDSALGLLESLFSAGNPDKLLVLCVADQHVLMEFITKKYGIPSFDGARYLEKIFPDYFRVPDPWVYWQKTRPESLQEAAKEGDIIANLLLSTVNAGSHPALKDARDLLWFTFSQVSALRNPRRIKRILRRLDRLPRSGVGYDFEAVFLLVILCDLWPHIERYRTTVSPDAWREFLTEVMRTGGSKLGPATDYEFRDFVVQMTGGDPAEEYHEATLADHDALEYALDVVRRLGL